MEKTETEIGGHRQVRFGGFKKEWRTKARDRVMGDRWRRWQ